MTVQDILNALTYVQAAYPTQSATLSGNQGSLSAATASNPSGVSDGLFDLLKANEPSLLESLLGGATLNAQTEANLRTIFRIAMQEASVQLKSTLNSVPTSDKTADLVASITASSQPKKISSVWIFVAVGSAAILVLGYFLFKK